MKNSSPKIWWDQEGISEKDLERLTLVLKADWIFSHMAPATFDLKWIVDEFYVKRKHFFQQSPKMLDRVYNKFHPKRWFFGHFHHFMKGSIDYCQCRVDASSRKSLYMGVWKSYDIRFFIVRGNS